MVAESDPSFPLTSLYILLYPLLLVSSHLTLRIPFLAWCGKLLANPTVAFPVSTSCISVDLTITP